MKTLRRKAGVKRSPTEWKRLVEEWLSSKEPIAAFCDQRHLTHSTFYYWRAKVDPSYKLEKSTKKRTVMDGDKPGFVTVEIEKQKPAHKTVLYYPNGCSIEFHQEINPKLLQLLNEGMGLRSC